MHATRISLTLLALCLSANALALGDKTAYTNAIGSATRIQAAAFKLCKSMHPASKRDTCIANAEAKWKERTVTAGSVYYGVANTPAAVSAAIAAERQRLRDAHQAAIVPAPVPPHGTVATPAPWRGAAARKAAAEAAHKTAP